MTICSYSPVLLQLPSNAHDMAMARCALALAAGFEAESMSFWNSTRASAPLPSRSSWIASELPRPPCADSAPVQSTAQGKNTALIRVTDPMGTDYLTTGSRWRTQMAQTTNCALG